jgi:hypothetical protein
MRHLLALAILPALVGPAQDGAFESPEFGVRLKIPAGWTVGTSDGATILKISLAGKHAFPAEIVVQNLAFLEEHITVGQYREQFRQFIQRQYADPRILDDKAFTVAGKPCTSFTWAWKAKEGPAVNYRAFIELSPMRMLSVEFGSPKTMEDAAKTWEALLATLEFFPRKQADGADERLKLYAESAAKLPATEAGFTRKTELDYLVGVENVGTYSQQMKAATKDGAAGVEMTTVDVIDLGANGRLERRSTVFVSDDLARQRAEVEVVHRGKERRIQYFTSNVAIEGGEATADRRINGEKSAVTVKVPERTILSDAIEILEFRLLAAGKGPMISVPVLEAFDNDVQYARMEHTGEYEMKAAGGGLVKVNVLVVARDTGVLTYWFDSNKKVMRRSVAGGNVVLQERK